jgi:integrase/recombinase XerD
MAGGAGFKPATPRLVRLGHSVPKTKETAWIFGSSESRNLLFFLINSPAVSLRLGFNSPRLHHKTPLKHESFSARRIRVLLAYLPLCYFVRMLDLYRRHLASCKFRTRDRKNCSCPLWVQGRLHGRMMRKSLDVRNWEAAQRIVRTWESRPLGEVLNVSDAVKRFINDCEARSLKPETLRKYQLMQQELTAQFGRRPIDGISVEDLSSYRQSWKLAPITSRKKIERLRTFFGFCLEREWIEKNPAALLRAPKMTFTPTLPFNEDETQKIRDALEKYPDRPAGRRQQVRAFVLLLAHTGLRITDAVCLSKNKIQGGKLLLYTAKTGHPVWLPLHPEVLRELEPLSVRPFWSGNGLPKSGVADWQRSLARLFEIAGVRGHAHRYRDSFAVRLLSSGVSIEDVAVLLGHADVRITQRHYAPWVKVRQERLEEAVQRAWNS